MSGFEDLPDGWQAYFGMVNNEMLTPLGQQTCCGIFNEPWTDRLNAPNLQRENARTLYLDYVALNYRETSSDPLQHGVDFRPWRGPNMRHLPGGQLSWTQRGQHNTRLGGPAVKAVFIHGHVLTTPDHPMGGSPPIDYWMPRPDDLDEQPFRRAIILEPGWGLAVVGAVNQKLLVNFQWAERPVTDAEWDRLIEWAQAHP